MTEMLDISLSLWEVFTLITEAERIQWMWIFWRLEYPPSWSSLFETSDYELAIENLLVPFRNVIIWIEEVFVHIAIRAYYPIS